MKKKRRHASLKYHPDKLRGDEKELYADVFINLNDNFETLERKSYREMYDNFGIRVNKDKHWDNMTDEEKEMKRVMSSLVSIPFYIIWAFIPMAYLEKEKRQAKLSCFAFVAIFAAFELTFLTGFLPKEHVLATGFKSLVPNDMTYSEMLQRVQTALPYLLSLLILYLDIYKYKTYAVDD